MFVEFGDLVQISDDIVEVQKFQKGHGEWAEEMSEVCLCVCVCVCVCEGVLEFHD